MESKKTSYAQVVGADPLAYGQALPPNPTRMVRKQESATQVSKEDYFPHMDLKRLYGETARSILGLSKEQWALMTVTDQAYNGRLIQVGYKKQVNPPFELQEIRGLVLDTVARVKVCPGSEFTEEIRLPEPELDIRDLTEEEMNDETRVKPEMRALFTDRPAQKIVVHSAVLDQDVEFDLDTDRSVRSRYYSQGTNLKIFLHAGFVHVITNSNLDPSGAIRSERWRQLWDKDPKFREFYADKGRGHTPVKAAYAHGPAFTDEFFRILGFNVRDFYPEGCLYSPYTYSFLLTMPNVVTSTRAVFPKTGYLTFIRKEANWRKYWAHNPQACPFKENEEDADEISTFYMGTPDYEGINVTEFFTAKKGELFSDAPLFGSTSDPSFITYPRTNLDIEQASSLLRYGFVPQNADLDLLDACLATDTGRNFLGEAIILTKKIKKNIEHPETGETTSRTYFYSVQLQPPAYSWRRDFFDKNNRQGDMFKIFVDSISVYSTARPTKTYTNLLHHYPLYEFENFTKGVLLEQRSVGAAEQAKNRAIAEANAVGMSREERIRYVIESIEKAKANYKQTHAEQMSVSESEVLEVFFRQLQAGRKFFPAIYIPPQTRVESNARYASTVEAITPYFICMLNPLRQDYAVKLYSRYVQQVKLLRDYIVKHPALKSEKAGPYSTNETGEWKEISELYTFAYKCTAEARDTIPNYRSEAGRSAFLSIITNKFERENSDRKLTILEQVTLKYGPEKLKEMMTLTATGSDEINVKNIKFLKVDRKARNQPFKRGPGPVNKNKGPKGNIIKTKLGAK